MNIILNNFSGLAARLRPKGYSGQAGVRRPSSPHRLPSSLDWRPAQRGINLALAPRFAGSGIRCLSSAFTLIEVLVAMTVLAILVLMAANIFQSSSASWNIGTQKADMNTSARAALEYMARELESAVAGAVEAINPPASPISFQVINETNVLFVSLVGDVNSGRALRKGSFYHNGCSNQLMYAHQVNNSPYTTLPDHSGAGMLITNVIGLNIYVYTNESQLASGIPEPNPTLYQLPICVDIALTMLSDDDMRRYNQLSVPADKIAFSDRNSKLYSTRIYFLNRNGYGAR